MEWAGLRDLSEVEAAVLDALSEGVVVHDHSGAVRLCNPAAERILGLSADELTGRTSMDPRWRAVHPDGTPWPGETHPAMVTLGDGQPVSGARMGVHRPDGTLVWLAVSSRALRDPSGAVAGVVATFVDVTELHHLADSLETSQRQFLQGFDASPIGMALVSPEREMLRVNHALVELLGWSEEELVPDGVPRIEHPEEAAEGAEMVRGLVAGEIATYRAERRFRHRDGHDVPVLMSSTLVRDGAGRPAYFFSQLVDLTELRQREVSLRLAAERDPLTGLANRRAYEAALDRVARADPAVRAATAVLLVDLDRFKAVNDHEGHEAGDALLRDIAEAMRRRVRALDLLARIGGDEFAVVLNGTDAAGAERVARELIAQIGAVASASPFAARVGVGASVGIALFPPDPCDPAAVVRDADRALYAAKGAGGGRCVVAASA